MVMYFCIHGSKHTPVKVEDPFKHRNSKSAQVVDKKRVTNSRQKARIFKLKETEAGEADEKEEKRQHSESAALVELLKERKRQNKDFFFKAERDSDNKLRRVFWMDPEQRS
ncbi:hypothetical protein BGZ79_008981 [Entomortierella chlamydospora]|nr:hypothetical protein BGZ79_008981 [Entomortierella chlamydospora]